MSENRFNRLDGTAPVVNAAEEKNVTVPKSVFDFSRSIAGPINVGLLYPIDCFDTVPSERIDIDISALVESVNPTVRKLLNGFDVYVHAYYNRESDLWEGSKNFTTKGRSGQISGSIPRVDMFGRPNPNENTGYVNFDTVGSLADWLGVQPNSESLKIQNDRLSYRPTFTETNPTHSSFVNAIPFFMYTRLWRDKYVPKNLLQNNKNIFPDNEDHFIIPYEAVRYNIVDYTPDTGSGEKQFYEHNFTTEMDDSDGVSLLVGSNVTNDASKLLTTVLRPRQFKGDDFTTASPFPDLVRGEIPDLGDFMDSPYSVTHVIDQNHYSRVNIYNPDVSTSTNTNTFSVVRTAVATHNPTELVIHNATIFSNVTTASLAALNAYTIFAERMGRTNGDYDAMIKAQFGFDPQNQSREARYLGGFHFTIGNETINQTSESTESGTALGTQVSQSLGSGQGRVASFTSPDFGYVMILLSVIPDTFYTLGQDEYLSSRYQTDRFFPIFEQLGPQPLLNREIYVSGTASVDNDVFGYVERNYRYKSRRNSVRGALRQNHASNDEYASRIMSRKFYRASEAVTHYNLNAFFTSAIDENIDYNIFSSPDDYPFILSARCNVKRIAPMSEYTAPAGFSPATM